MSWLFSTPRRKLVGILQQVIRKCHLLFRPLLFLKDGLLCYASEVVVWKESKLGKVQSLSQAPYDLRRNVAQSLFAGLVRQQDPEENRPLITPVCPMS